MTRRNLTISLEDDVFASLVREAGYEIREPRQQVLYLVVEGLRRAKARRERKEGTK